MERTSLSQIKLLIKLCVGLTAIEILVIVSIFSLQVR